MYKAAFNYLLGMFFLFLDMFGNQIGENFQLKYRQTFDFGYQVVVEKRQLPQSLIVRLQVVLD